MTYEINVCLATAEDEKEFRPDLGGPIPSGDYNLEELEGYLTIEADNFASAKEKARDYIAHELEKRGLRPEKSGRTESVGGYDGEAFVCEFYGFDEP